MCSSHSSRLLSQKAKKYAKPILPFGVRVILAVGEGKTIREISTLFKVSRQRVEYHVKKALSPRLLRKQGHYPALYYITDRGKQKFLKTDEGMSSKGELNIRVHGACLGFRIFKSPSTEGLKRLVRDGRKVPLKNWTAFHTDCGGLSVKITTKRALIYVRSSWVASKYFKETAVLESMTACQEVAAILCSKYGFKLDILHPELITVPQYALPDSFTDDGEKVRLTFEKGAIDYSKDYRELEYNKAEHLSDFLSMPERLQHIEALLEDKILLKKRIGSGAICENKPAHTSCYSDKESQLIAGDS